MALSLPSIREETSADVEWGKQVHRFHASANITNLSYDVSNRKNHSAFGSCEFVDDHHASLGLCWRTRLSLLLGFHSDNANVHAYNANVHAYNANVHMPVMEYNVSIS